MKLFVSVYSMFIVQYLTSERHVCAIPDNDEVILTGGMTWTLTTVSVYNEAGWLRDLTPLNQGRYRHACSSFILDGERVLRP